MHYRARLALATGSERSAFHEAVRRSELLHLIGNGAPLGLFVLGIARYANDAGKEDEFLDRLNNRDHALLRCGEDNDWCDQADCSTFAGNGTNARRRGDPRALDWNRCQGEFCASQMRPSIVRRHGS